jgi:hypothetical protein
VNEAGGTVTVLLNNYGAPPTATSVLSSVNPADVRSAVTYSASVTAQSGGPLKGTVTFLDGGATIATVPLEDNQAACTTSYTRKGTHSIMATYSGVLNQATGSAATLTEVIVQPHVTKTLVTTSGSPSFVGQPVTFTATVTSTFGPIPDGELVTFTSGTTALASVPLAKGKAAYTTSSLPAKSQTIKATYAGEVTFRTSYGFVTQIVESYPTTTTLTSSPNPSTHGQPVTFTATVTSSGPIPPTGKVMFKDGTSGIGSAAVSGGVATVTKFGLAIGTHSITAEYLGDSASAKSTSTILSQVVD